MRSAGSSATAAGQAAATDAARAHQQALLAHQCANICSAWQANTASRSERNLRVASCEEAVASAALTDRGVSLSASGSGSNQPLLALVALAKAERGAQSEPAWCLAVSGRHACKQLA